MTEPLTAEARAFRAITGSADFKTVYTQAQSLCQELLNAGTPEQLAFESKLALIQQWSSTVNPDQLRGISDAMHKASDEARQNLLAAPTLDGILSAAKTLSETTERDVMLTAALTIPTNGDR